MPNGIEVVHTYCIHTIIHQYSVGTALPVVRYDRYYTVLYCTVLYWTVLYCTVLYYTVLYCTVLYWGLIPLRLSSDSRGLPYTAVHESRFHHRLSRAALELDTFLTYCTSAVNRLSLRAPP